MGPIAGTQGQRGQSEAAQKSPLVLLLSQSVSSETGLGTGVTHPEALSPGSRPWHLAQLFLHTNKHSSYSMAGFASAFSLFPHAAGTWEDPEPLMRLQGNNLIIENEGQLDSGEPFAVYMYVSNYCTL